MIGRFSNLGVYRHLFQSGEFARALLAGCLALASYLWDSVYGPNLAVERWFADLLGSYLWDGAHEPGITIGLVLALASTAINGLPILWGAFTGIMQHRVNVDELVSLAIIACLIQGEVLTAAVVSFVMVMGSLIEQATSDAVRKSIQSLMDLSPQTATVVVGGNLESRPVSQIQVGDLLLVKPGERIPVEGSTLLR